MRTINLLQGADKLADKARELSDGQKKAIEALQTQVAKEKEKLELALQLGQRMLERGEITADELEVASVTAKVQSKASINELYTKIREINPSFMDNAGDVIDEIVNRYAFKAVQFSGKAAGAIGQVIRPFVQALKEGYEQGRAVANKGYTKPEPKKNHIDQLEEASK